MRYDPTQEMQIGKTPDGKPIHILPTDLDLQPGESDQLADNKADQKHDKNVHQLALQVIEGIQGLMFATLKAIAPRHLKTGVDADIWCHQNGFRFTQDGLKTAVIVRDKVIREAEAQVSPDVAFEVAREVERLLKLEQQAMGPSQ